MIMKYLKKIIGTLLFAATVFLTACDPSGSGSGSIVDIGGSSAPRPNVSGTPGSVETPPEVTPQEGDYVVLKPRFSAFFHTELDLILRRLGVRTLYLTGTTTPNCIRTTCYDGLSLDYNVGILTDCCSSNSDEIQQANMVDMANIGATLMTCAEFCDGKQATDWTGLVQAELL